MKDHQILLIKQPGSRNEWTLEAKRLGWIEPYTLDMQSVEFYANEYELHLGTCIVYEVAVGAEKRGLKGLDMHVMDLDMVAAIKSAVEALDEVEDSDAMAPGSYYLNPNDGLTLLSGT